MSNELIIILASIYCFSFGIFHIFFWKLFDWERDLNRVSLTNRAIFQILNLRLIYIFFFASFVCIIYPQELLNSLLGKILLFGGFLFWLGRAIEQIIFFKFKSILDYVIIVVFIIGSLLFLIPIIK